jgi:prevent-host-death family protein
MPDVYPIAEARGLLGDLVRRAAQHEQITITDRGTPAAMLVSREDWENLEDALALARLERDRALRSTQAPVPWATARAELLRRLDDAADRGEVR